MRFEGSCEIVVPENVPSSLKLKIIAVNNPMELGGTMIGSASRIRLKLLKTAASIDRSLLLT